MASFKGIVSCAVVMLFTAALFAQEKPAAQAAPSQVATAVKSQGAPEEKTAAVKKDEDAMAAHCKKMPCMHEGMCMCAKLVATSDGGVVILRGNQLFKYDANLKLVKEAEIKPPAEPAKKAEKPKAPEAKPAAPKPAPVEPKK